MKANRARRVLILFLLVCGPLHAAGDACAPASIQQAPTELARRIAAIACAENTLWFTPFIDGDGRLASTRVAESENARLNDHATPAWQRVVDYWKQTGLLWQMGRFPGANECSYASPGLMQTAACRVFVIDNPWSAVFVSWVMQKAGVPDFSGSASHIDYVRDAYLNPATSPYRFTNPDAERPAAGDLLCFVRAQATALGYNGLMAYVQSNPGGGLKMHCDIAVSVDGGTLSLVGGNVLQGVTRRILHLNREGLLWGLPRRGGMDASCSPANIAGCNFNRQDWAVLLKLKPLAPTQQSWSLPTPSATQPACCVNCVVGADPPIPRCQQDGGLRWP